MFNPNRYRLFLGQLEDVEQRSAQPVFQRTRGFCFDFELFLVAAHLEMESESSTRAAVLAHLNSLCAKVKCNRNARLVRAWHGSKASVVDNVLENGFAAIAMLDDGWFGKGIYFSTNASYAARYADTPRCLVMCCKRA